MSIVRWISLCVLLAVSGMARADTLTVYVFDYDFSVNDRDDKVVDAVVHVGDTVRWYFLDNGYSATAVNGIPEKFDSGYVGVVGTEYEHTFTHVGTWWYYCFPHGNDLGDGTAVGMVGTVTVLFAADFDGDGFVTGIDFDLFVDAFEAGDQIADFDGDGFLTEIDFDLFVQAFEAEC